ncbi:unnamed protein product [Lactuca saligna]|uniref:Uncharacterized protein n=1 Tax=Lactuca saligna TaxID=75948 RepID=A0AA35ZV98_LACSI|nr:unnamed protein product [Lactuca saligna]
MPRTVEALLDGAAATKREVSVANVGQVVQSTGSSYTFSLSHFLNSFFKEDFDEFEDVDMLYNTLSLDKVEALEDLVIIGPPGLVKGVGATVYV